VGGTFKKGSALANVIKKKNSLGRLAKLNIDQGGEEGLDNGKVKPA